MLYVISVLYNTVYVQCVCIYMQREHHNSLDKYYCMPIYKPSDLCSAHNSWQLINRASLELALS